MNEEQRMAQVLAGHRKVIHKVLVKITIYYAVLTAVVAIAIAINPGIVDDLPLGGVGESCRSPSSGPRRARPAPSAPRRWLQLSGRFADVPLPVADTGQLSLIQQHSSIW